MSHRLNRIGTPHMYGIGGRNGTSLSNANEIESSVNIKSQSIFGTYPETYGTRTHRHDTNQAITADNMLLLHWGLSVPEILAADSVVIEYSLSSLVEFNGDTGWVQPFAGLVDSQVATGSIADGDKPYFLEANVDRAGNNVFVTARGSVAFHGGSPGVLGVTQFPVIGVSFGSFDAINLLNASTTISLRRPTLDETYPKYQDTLR